MFIVVGTDIGFLLKAMNLGENISAATSVIRGFRIGRIFRLVKASISVRLLIDTLLNILPQIRNIMGLMAVLLFIYSSLGMNLFSKVKSGDQITDKNNFRRFDLAMLMLLRCVTGEDWNLIMYELANKEDCKLDQTYEEIQVEGLQGCGSSTSFIFFLSFMVILSFLIMNLTVAAVLEGLDTARKENLGIVSGDVLDNFIALWKDYDPKASGWLTVDNLVFLLSELDEPLGRRKKENNVKDEEFDDDTIANSSEKERYMEGPKKNLFIKKVKALSMLKDNLDIKIYNDISNETGQDIKIVHYMDVLRGLLKRRINET